MWKSLCRKVQYTYSLVQKVYVSYAVACSGCSLLQGALALRWNHATDGSARTDCQQIRLTAATHVHILRCSVIDCHDRVEIISEALVTWWLVWQRCGNAVDHINKVKLRRVRLVLWWVTTFGWSTIPVFIQAHSAWPTLRGLVQWVLAMVSATAGEETASSA